MSYQPVPRQVKLVRLTLACALFAALCAFGYFAPRGSAAAAQSAPGARRPTPVEAGAPVFPKFEDADPGGKRAPRAKSSAPRTSPQAIITVQSTGATATVPTPTDNDYTRVSNAVDALNTGDTLIFEGTFNWTEPNAAASWALGNDDTTGTLDDFSVLVPANINDVTLTANVLGDATFQGPGDLAAVNLEGVFVFDGGDNQNWTISNLRFLDFDLSIGMFGGAGGTDAFNDTEILDNYIRVPSDLNATAAPVDVSQNIGIHFAFGTNQRIATNTIEFPGDGLSVSANSTFAASVGMQSNTSGSDIYDGLLITDNTLRVLNAQSADPETILGIWENAHGHTSDITVSDNQFLNQAAGNNPALNLQRAFRVTSHSGAATTVAYTGNTSAGANIGFQWLAASNFAGNQPVRLWENTLTGNATGVLVQSSGLANLYRNAVTASGAGGGVNVSAGTLAASGPVLNAVEENFISGGTGDGLRIASGSASGPVFNNDLGGNTGFGLNNLSASTIDASMNYWGTNTGAGVLAETNGPVDYNPFLDTGTDTAPATPGFQGDFSSLHADDNGAQTGSTGRIQEAVNRSTGPNPIVAVEPGTYTEHVTVNKTVRLRGAQFGVDARDASRTGLTPTAAESIVNGPGGSFSLLANGIELDGFTIEGTTATSPLGAGVFTSAAFSGYAIRNNIVQDNIIGVYLNASGVAQTVFEKNVVRDNDNPGPAGGTGVYSDQGLSNALIQNNRVTGENPTAGVNLAGTQAMITITANEFLTGNQLVLFSTDNSTVSSNAFSGLLPSGGGGTAVFIGGGSDNLSVTGNSMTDRAAGAISASDFGPGPNTNLTVTSNTVTQNAALFTANRSLISLNGVGGTSNVGSNTVTLSGTLTPTLFVHGIDIQGAATGTINVSGNTLNGGGVDAADAASESAGIRLRLSASGGVITLTNNTVSGFMDGVKADKIPLTITGGSYSSNEDDGLEFATGFLTTLSISSVSVTGNAGDGLLVTNAAQGGTFNLSDLILTGNGAGGQITNVSTFNFSPSTGTNADVVTFNATQFQHTRDGSPQQAVLYSAINALSVSTGGGTDSVTHSAIGNHPGGLTIDGGAGTGDSFVIDDTGRTSTTTYTINPTTVTRTGTPGTVVVSHSGLESLAANGGSGSDTFNVTASPTTAFSVDGNAAGDTLNYNAEGRPATRTPPSGPDGTITSPGVQPVTFFDIESVNISSTLQSLSVGDTVVAEPTTGSRNALFTVRLSAAEAVNVSVNFTTSDGTATAGADYTPTSGTITFLPGQTVQTISVPVLSDGPGEPDETFTVTLSSPTNAVIGDGTATGTITEGAQSAGIVMISELRTSGPLGATDEFVELYNNSSTTLTVASTDGSAGWGVYKMGSTCQATPVLIASIPNGTNIPARGHYLLIGTNYSLANYGGTGAATGDQPLTLDIENDRNVGLFSTVNVQNLASSARLDAVGFLSNTGNNCDLLSEGSVLAPASGSASEYSFVRNLTTGAPLDRGNNATDFQIVSTTPATAVGSNPTPVLGAPGPENRSSPVQRNGSLKASPVDACVGSATSPNRVRDSTPDPNPANNSAAGTLTIRRKFTNNTGGAISRLRFRIVDITTFNSPGYSPGGPQADLRARSSAPTSVTVSVACGGASVPVRGTTLEEPPTQTNGGGINSTLAVGAITLGTPLAAGASTNVQFLLGVQQAGNFRFFVNVEALPGGPPFFRDKINAQQPGKSGDDKEPEPQP